jgi:hypothetical protein
MWQRSIELILKVNDETRKKTAKTFGSGLADTDLDMFLWDSFEQEEMPINIFLREDAFSEEEACLAFL